MKNQQFTLVLHSLVRVCYEGYLKKRSVGSDHCPLRADKQLSVEEKVAPSVQK